MNDENLNFQFDSEREIIENLRSLLIHIYPRPSFIYLYTYTYISKAKLFLNPAVIINEHLNLMVY